MNKIIEYFVCTSYRLSNMSSISLNCGSKCWVQTILCRQCTLRETWRRIVWELSIAAKSNYSRNCVQRWSNVQGPVVLRNFNSVRALDSLHRHCTRPEELSRHAYYINVIQLRKLIRLLKSMHTGKNKKL